MTAPTTLRFWSLGTDVDRLVILNDRAGKLKRTAAARTNTAGPIWPCDISRNRAVDNGQCAGIANPARLSARVANDCGVRNRECADVRDAAAGRECPVV